MSRQRVNDVKKKCNSVVELLENLNVPNWFDFEISLDEKVKIIRYGNLVRRAQIDVEEYKQIHNLNNQSEDIDYEKVYEYSGLVYSKDTDGGRTVSVASCVFYGHGHFVRTMNSLHGKRCRFDWTLGKKTNQLSLFGEILFQAKVVQ